MLSIATEFQEGGDMNKKSVAHKVLWAFALLLGAAPAFSGRAMADVGGFYKGKTINVIVGFSAGGGYDAYARALARTFGSHIPGNPTVIVQNMVGAGSLRAAHYLQDVAPRDGLTFGTFDNGLLLAAIMTPSDGFDASKLSWIGAVSKDLQMIITRD